MEYTPTVHLPKCSSYHHTWARSTAGHRTCGRRMMKIIISSRRRRKTESRRRRNTMKWYYRTDGARLRRTQYGGEEIVRTIDLQCSAVNITRSDDCSQGRRPSNKDWGQRRLPMKIEYSVGWPIRMRSKVRARCVVHGAEVSSIYKRSSVFGLQWASVSVVLKSLLKVIVTSHC